MFWRPFIDRHIDWYEQSVISRDSYIWAKCFICVCVCVSLCVCNIDKGSVFSKELDFQRANDLINLNSDSTFYFPRNCIYAIMRILSKYRLLLGEIFVKTNNIWQRRKRNKINATYIFFSWKRDVKTKSVRTTEWVGRKNWKEKNNIWNRGNITNDVKIIKKTESNIDSSLKGTEN